MPDPIGTSRSRSESYDYEAGTCSAETVDRTVSADAGSSATCGFDGGSSGSQDSGSGVGKLVASQTPSYAVPDAEGPSCRSELAGAVATCGLAVVGVLATGATGGLLIAGAVFGGVGCGVKVADAIECVEQ